MYGKEEEQCCITLQHNFGFSVCSCMEALNRGLNIKNSKSSEDVKQITRIYYPAVENIEV
jgi:hypothetical protein